MVIAARPTNRPAANMLSRVMVEYSGKTSGSDPVFQLASSRRVPVTSMHSRRAQSVPVAATLSPGHQSTSSSSQATGASTIGLPSRRPSHPAIVGAQKKPRPVEAGRAVRGLGSLMTRDARHRACPQRQDLRSVRNEELTVVILFARDGKLDVGIYIYADDVRLDSCKNPQGHRCGGAHCE